MTRSASRPKFRSRCVGVVVAVVALAAIGCNAWHSKRVAEAFFLAVNDGSSEALLALFVEDGEVGSPEFARPLQGESQLRPFFEFWIKSGQKLEPVSIELDEGEQGSRAAR